MINEGFDPLHIEPILYSDFFLAPLLKPVPVYLKQIALLVFSTLHVTESVEEKCDFWFMSHFGRGLTRITYNKNYVA